MKNLVCKDFPTQLLCKARPSYVLANLRSAISGEGLEVMDGASLEGAAGWEC